MAIAESDISILIPTYLYRDKVARAVESALASGAGEIIVVDDCSKDGTVERLSAYADPRLSVIENDRNLGLWENHLSALGFANKPWIKFIQADDYLLPGGLACYAAAADQGVTVISGAPILKDDKTGRTWVHYELSSPTRLDWPLFELACALFGNFLGSPSYMMLRANAIERDPALWNTKISADMVVGVIAAARGAVVILPPGAIGHGVHPLQDARTQGTVLALERVARSLAYLRARPEQGLRRLANIWTALSILSTLWTMVRCLARLECSPIAALTQVWRTITDLSLNDWHCLRSSWDEIRAAAEFRRNSSPPFDLDDIIRPPYARVRSLGPWARALDPADGTN